MESLVDPWGFPLSSSGKGAVCNAGDPGLIPGSGRSAGEGKGYLLQYSGLENSMNCMAHGVKKIQTRLSDFQMESILYVLLNIWLVFHCMNVSLYNMIILSFIFCFIEV